MSDFQNGTPSVAVKSGPRFSVVWLLPVIAALLGIWLLVDTILKQGPEITISFKSAEGLEAGKTKIKFRDLEIGKVIEIIIKKDLSGIIVVAELQKDTESHLTEETKFWVVKPRLDVRGISGLGTIVSGAFIAIEPTSKGSATKSFIGLETPPVVKIDAAGKEFILTTTKLGSYRIGSPVLSRGIEVGEILGSELAADGKNIEVHVFVKAPHDKLVKENTRFWDVSGINISLDADGMQIRTASLTSLFIGGIAFETPPKIGDAPLGENLSKFVLYDNKAAIQTVSYSRKIEFISYFDNSVRGLNVGAPIEFKGIKIGTVKDVKIEFDAENTNFRIPVLYEIELDRISEIKGNIIADGAIFPILIERGLRAQLKSGNIVTGQLVVNLDFHPGSPAKYFGEGGIFNEIPTVPSTLDELTSSITDLIAKIKNLPLDKIAKGLEKTLTNANRVIKSADEIINTSEAKNLVRNLDTSIKRFNSIASKVDIDMMPRLTAVIQEANETLATVKDAVSENSPLRYNLENTLEELSKAARSVRGLAEYLERNPNALISGKKAN